MRFLTFLFAALATLSFSFQSVQAEEIITTINSTYVVQPGDTLTSIADGFSSMTTTDLRDLNADRLTSSYDDKCKGLSQAQRRASAFCNKDFGNLTFSSADNTLLPGEVLRVTVAAAAVTPPAPKLAEGVAEAVVAIDAEKIALVIDASASMGEASDQAILARLYKEELAGRVTHVIFFADKTVTKEVIDGEFPELVKLTGGFERVGTALDVAAALDVQAIVLIGDAGDNEAGNVYQGLPPVTAHCLTDSQEDVPCQGNFAKIAEVTGGQLVVD